MRKSLHNPGYRAFTGLLRDLRLEQGLTQVELASRLGVSQELISKVERGVRRLDVVEFRDWCRGLGVPFLDTVKRLDTMLPHSSRK